MADGNPNDDHQRPGRFFESAGVQDFLTVLNAENPAVSAVASVPGRKGGTYAAELRSIKRIEAAQPEFSRLNFVPRDYVDERGKSQPEYLMTRDGFALLAMGFTVDTQNEYTMHTKNGFTSYAPCNTSLRPVSLLSCPTSCEASEEPSKEDSSLADVTSLDQPMSDAEQEDSSHGDGCDPDAWRASAMDDAMPVDEVIPMAEGSSARRPRARLVYLDAWRGAGVLGSHRVPPPHPMA